LHPARRRHSWVVTLAAAGPDPNSNRNTASPAENVATPPGGHYQSADGADRGSRLRRRIRRSGPPDAHRNAARGTDTQRNGIRSQQHPSLSPAGTPTPTTVILEVMAMEVLCPDQPRVRQCRGPVGRAQPVGPQGLSYRHHQRHSRRHPSHQGLCHPPYGRATWACTPIRRRRGHDLTGASPALRAGRPDWAIDSAVMLANTYG
jgi:hypothetical protein